MSKPKPSAAIGARIQQRREELGWTQRDLGGRVGVQRDQIQRWESGQANPLGETRERACLALGVRETWLTSGTGPKLIATCGSGDEATGDP